MKAEELSLTVVIPVFNEARRLQKTFAAVRDFAKEFKFLKREIIFIDDGSQDATASLIKEFHVEIPFRLIAYPANRGKGYAVRTGILASRGDYALILDADMSSSFNELKKAVPLMARGCPVIIGTRRAKGAAMLPAQPWYRKKLGEAYTVIANLITGVGVSDFTCGFKCFSKAAIEKIFSKARIDRWSYDAEILFLARRAGLEIAEVPVAWRNDADTRVRLTKDVLRSFLDLFKIRFGSYSKN